MIGFELAPAAVVRVASWPAAALDRLQDPALSELACADGVGAGAAYRAAYAVAIERQRRELAAITVADPRFRCAVAVASPGLARALEAWPRDPPRRNKRARHIETSLLRYLARAIGRTEPAGLWTGVTLARLGTSTATRFRTRPHRVDVAPELGPFRAIFQQICERAPHAERGWFRINPSLRRDGDVWRVAQRWGSGRVAWIELPPTPIWGVLDEHAGDARWSLDELIAALAGTLGTDVAAAAVALARSAGVLVGGLVFPRRFARADEALSAAGELLIGVAGEAWARARAEVMQRCDALAIALAATMDGRAGASAADVLAVGDAVRAAVVGLRTTLALPDAPLPAAMLRVDLIAPVEIDLGRDDVAELAAIVTDWERTESRWSGLRRHRRRVARLFGERMSMGLFEPPQPPASADDDGVPAAGPPFAALVVRPGAAHICGRLRGVSDAPTATHARHAAALQGIGDPLLAWFQRRLARLSDATGIEIVDLVSDAVASPNVTARPAYVPHSLHPWSADELGLDRGAELWRWPTPDTPIVRTRGRRLAAYLFSAATAPLGDPITARLLSTSFSSLADGSEPDSDVGPDTTSQRPRSQTDGGRDMSGASTWLARSECEALSRARGADRFRLWSRLARAHGFPPLVWLARANRTPLLVATHSALAVEAALEGFTGEKLAVEESLEGGWLLAADGGRRAELVLPMYRMHNLWLGPDTAGGTLDAGAR